MQIEMEIGATVESWKLGTDDALDIWLRSCPWRSGELSQLRTVRSGGLFMPLMRGYMLPVFRLLDR